MPQRLTAKAWVALGLAALFAALGGCGSSSGSSPAATPSAAATPQSQLFSCVIGGREDVSISGNDVTEMVSGEQSLQIDQSGNITALALTLQIEPSSDASGVPANTASCGYALGSGTYQNIQQLGTWTATVTANSGNDPTLCPAAGSLQGGMSVFNSGQGLVLQFSLDGALLVGNCNQVSAQ